MGFPTVPIVDDFNRADEGPPPSSNWTALVNGFTVASNQMAVDVGGSDNITGWNVTTFTNVDTFIFLPTVDGTWAIGLINTATVDGYLFRYDGAGDIFLERVDSGVPGATLATTSHTPANGNGYGYRRINNSHSGWLYTGGAWQSTPLLDGGSDSTHSGALTAVVIASSSAWRGDDFGVGVPAAVNLLKGQLLGRPSLVG